jgi:hypothetical protein
MRFLGVLLAAVVVLLSSQASSVTTTDRDAVVLLRVPDRGIQPQVVLESGVLHLLYFAGEARAGDLFYARSSDYGSTFSAPVRVNSQQGSAIATGTIRGGQLAIGADGRAHVVWNGSDAATPRGIVNPASGQPSAPFLYARSNAGGTDFETQRDLTRRSYGIDGGGSIATDAAGHVYAAWQALPVGGANGEDHRLVWVARSQDNGSTFAEERPAWREPTGACGCCGLRLFAGPANNLFLLYRSATELTHRDIYLLESTDHGESFRGSEVQSWDIGACPMTSMSITTSGSRVFGAWETAGQVYFGEVDIKAARVPTPIAAPATGANRKHPRLAANSRGDMLFVWTEGTAWARGGSLVWQAFDAGGRPSGPMGRATGVPVWSFPAPVARPDGSFVILY